MDTLASRVGRKLDSGPRRPRVGPDFVGTAGLAMAGHGAGLAVAVQPHERAEHAELVRATGPGCGPRFFRRALRAGTIPADATTDRAAAYPQVLDELIPSALHITER